MAVAAVVFDGEAPRMGPTGPEMVFAVLPPSDVEIVDTWKVTGLKGTSSHDLRVNGVFVPQEMTGPFGLPGGPRAVRPSIAARFPFFCVVGIAQTPPVALGIARHALDDFRTLALAKERPFSGRLSDQAAAQAGLARAEALLRSGRSYWFETVRCAWDRVASGGELSLEERANLKLASLTATENAVAAVDTVYRLAGSSAVFESENLERCWRDVHTAAQHLQVQDSRWETAGRILFGLEPASPFI
jgi:alkylation response protein AidB-like acyl-CoA dehydrogenase